MAAKTLPPKASATPQPVAPAAAPTGGTAPRSRWVLAGLGGVVFTLGMFLFLAWLQPAFDQNQRFDLASVVKYKIVQNDRKPPPPRPQETEPEVQPRKKPRPRKAKPSTIKRTTARQVRRPAQAAHLRPSAALAGRSAAMLAPSFSGGGATIQLPQGDAFEEIAGEAIEFLEYQRGREAARQLGGRPTRATRGVASGGEPVPVDTPGPRYPSSAERKQIEGFVRLRLLISREGTVEDSEIVISQPEGVFDEAIERVLPRWKFRAATDDKGRPIESWTEFNYVFKLEDA